MLALGNYESFKSFVPGAGCRDQYIHFLLSHRGLYKDVYTKNLIMEAILEAAYHKGVF